MKNIVGRGEICLFGSIRSGGPGGGILTRSTLKSTNGRNGPCRGNGSDTMWCTMLGKNGRLARTKTKA